MSEPQKNKFGFPEPVSSEIQLLLLPFLVSLKGLILGINDGREFRITAHRSIARAGALYFQQACTYVGTQPFNQKVVGRVYPYNQGIMGKACIEKAIYRTKHYRTEQDLNRDLALDKADAKDTEDSTQVGLSWLAIPLLSPQEKPVLVLYFETWKFNLFSDDSLVMTLTKMCEEYCGLLDWIEDRPFKNFRNFPPDDGTPSFGEEPAYARIQEEFRLMPAPKFRNVSAFNFEARTK